MKTTTLLAQNRNYNPVRWILLFVLVCTIANCTKDPDTVIGEASKDLSKILLVKLNTVDGNSWPCSKKFVFVAEIKADGPMTVSYTWLHSDGTTVPAATLIFEEAGTKTVTTSWTFRESGNLNENYWKQLKIIAPKELFSNKAEFNLYCDSENRVELVSLLPTSPAVLSLSNHVEFALEYATSESAGVRIFGRPFSGGRPTPGYRVHQSSILYNREGTYNGHFTIQGNPVHIDQIRFRMWDADQNTLLYESFVDVHYRFVGHTVDMVAATPSAPATL